MTATSMHTFDQAMAADKARPDGPGVKVSVACETFAVRSLWLNELFLPFIQGMLDQKGVQYLTGKHPVCGFRLAVAEHDWPVLDAMMNKTFQPVDP